MSPRTCPLRLSPLLALALLGALLIACDGGGNGGGEDAGMSQLDSGLVGTDSGTSDTDAGPAGTDAGISRLDAGPVGTDAGPIGTDSGMSRLDAGPDGVSCDRRDITCRIPEPMCPDGQTASVIGSCYGPCVPIDACFCTEAAACPQPDIYTCHMSRMRCGPFVGVR